MKTRLAAAISFVLLTSLAARAESAPDTHKILATQTEAGVYARLPLSFEPNQGQAQSQARFVSHGNGYSLALTDAGAVLRLSQPPRDRDKRTDRKTARRPQPSSGEADLIGMDFAGALSSPRVEGVNQLPGTSNYFLGRDSSAWRTGIPTYAKVRYTAVYPGVDLVFYGNQRQLEYDFLVAPGANPGPVKLHFGENAKLSLQPGGDLLVVAKHGRVAFQKPVVYQQKNGQRQPVAGQFALLAHNTVGFTLGDYDHTRQLVIDPVLAYSTYITSSVDGGGGPYGQAEISGLAVDSLGSAYMAGHEVGFPGTYGAYATPGNDNIRSVAKLNPAGTALVYSAFFPNVYVVGVAVDAAGSAYITGSTGANSSFPVTPGAFQQTPATPNSSPAFVTKLSPDGSSLIYSTLLGGTSVSSAPDQGYAIAVDSSGSAYVAGYASSQDFPTTSGALQPKNRSSYGSNGFVTKLNVDGSGLVYSTYFGGKGSDYAFSLALDQYGGVYISGIPSPGFVTTPGAFASHNLYGGYVAKLNAQGTALVYSTYFPAGQFLSLTNLAIDSGGYAYVGGTTGAGYIPPTPGAYQTTCLNFCGTLDKLNPQGTAVVYATFLGGSNSTNVESVAVDSHGNAFLTGQTEDNDFPVTADAFQSVNRSYVSANSPGSSAFLAEINPAGSQLLYSTYLGGTRQGGYGDQGTQIVLDPLGNPYIAGETPALDFPVTPGAYQTHNTLTDSAFNGFLAKFALNGATVTTLSANANPASAGAPITLTAHVDSVQDNLVPHGLVEFYIDGNYEKAVSLDGSGDAAYATSTLPTGPHSIIADYLGTPAHSASSGTLSEIITGSTVAPTILPVGGTYPGTQKIILADATSGAVIHYTTDGTDPSVSSTVYTAPIHIAASSTVKAIAAAAGDSPSPATTAVYTIDPNASETSTSLTATPASITAGASISLVATVTAHGATAQGSVTFLHGSVIIGTAPLVGGSASLNVSDLGPGLYSITANYSGSATEAASPSPAVVVSIRP